MGCPPVHRDNPKALVSGQTGITILYHLYQFRPCTSQDISYKVGKGGINSIPCSFSWIAMPFQVGAVMSLN